jgi:uncharacterized oxidoreductase
MRITGNTIFIPGATSGIGLGLALRLHALGNTVIVGGRRRHLIEQIARENPGIDGVVIDTADPDSITTAAAQVLATWPETNVLITVAGSMTLEDVHSGAFVPDAVRSVTTNLLGPIRLFGAFIEHFLAQSDATVVNVASGLAFAPWAPTPTYNATKAAIHMFDESIRLQLADTNVKVLELIPPKVQTPLIAGLDQDPTAMPLDEFLDETMHALEHQPTGDEIMVDRVHFLRHPEAHGGYDQVVSILNAH